MQTRPTMNGPRAGFTLVEILIAMLLASLVALCVHAAYRQAQLLSGRLERGRELYQMVRQVTELLRVELGGVVVPPSAGKQDAGAKAFHISAHALEFFSLSPCRRGHVANSQMARVSYHFAEGLLTRTEQLYSGEKKLGPEYQDVVARDLAEFSLVAFDAAEKKWKDSYSSPEAAPLAIRLTLRCRADDPSRAAAFVTVLAIPAGTLRRPSL